MKPTMEEMKNEALARMAILRMLPQPIREFKEEGKLNLSENGGFLYWLDEEQERMVRDWEKETGNLVYHVVRSFTNFGEMLTLLYVSKYKEEWEMDIADLKDGVPFCYVYNKDMPDCSEYGGVAIEPRIGGVVRVF